MADPQLSPGNAALETALQAVEAGYIAANPRSQAHSQSAQAYLPGGSTRSAIFYTPFPVVIQRAEGVALWDIDDHQYTDFLGEYSSGIYGHSHPIIQTAISEALTQGIALGGPNQYEAQLAELICNRFPSCELVRFCNSGTEANLMAISAARATTGREAMMVFHGGYHGGVFNYEPGGSSMNAPYPTILADYNDLEGMVDLIEANAARLAAVLIEPMQGAGGGIPARADFLQALRDATTRHGIVLIFDEVMTSRLSSGGLQKRLGIIPDMTTMGKYLGGGLTFGAFGGQRELMAHFDPYRPTPFPHSGTFNNNVLTMAAGVAGLSKVFTPDEAERLNQAADHFRERLNAVARHQAIPLQTLGVGSIICLHFQNSVIEQTADAVTPPALRALFHLYMLSQGIYLSRRGYMSLSIPMVDKDFDHFVTAFEQFAGTYRAILQALPG